MKLLKRKNGRKIQCISIIIKCLRMFQFINMNLEINEMHCTNKTAIKLK